MELALTRLLTEAKHLKLMYSRDPRNYSKVTLSAPRALLFPASPLYGLQSSTELSKSR